MIKLANHTQSTEHTDQSTPSSHINHPSNNPCDLKQTIKSIEHLSYTKSNQVRRQQANNQAIKNLKEEIQFVPRFQQRQFERNFLNRKKR